MCTDDSATTSFGTVSLVLQLVPVLSMFFLMSTAAGSALWVADIERKRALLAHEHAQTPDDDYRYSTEP